MCRQGGAAAARLMMTMHIKKRLPKHGKRPKYAYSIRLCIYRIRLGRTDGPRRFGKNALPDTSPSGHAGSVLLVLLQRTVDKLDELKRAAKRLGLVAFCPDYLALPRRILAILYLNYKRAL